MSARIQPCGEFVILTATLSLSFALGILFLYRVLYVFMALTPTCAAVSLPFQVLPKVENNMTLT